MSRINLDSNPLFHQINSSVVVAVINFIYTGNNIFIDPIKSTFFLRDRLHEQQHRRREQPL